MTAEYSDYDDDDETDERISGRYGENMRIHESGDGARFWIALGVNTAISLAGTAFMVGALSQRTTANEKDIAKLEQAAVTASSKDNSQDIQVATMAVQLTGIQVGVNEIKAKLDAKR